MFFVIIFLLKLKKKLRTNLKNYKFSSKIAFTHLLRNINLIIIIVNECYTL